MPNGQREERSSRQQVTIVVGVHSQVGRTGFEKQDTVFRSVAAFAPSTAWTVGYIRFFGAPQTPAEHWISESGHTGGPVSAQWPP